VHKKLIGSFSDIGVMVLGSLHLTMMAMVGVWLWSSPARFELSQDPDKLLPLGSIRHPFECTSITLLGKSDPIKSTGLRAWSLLAYSLVLVPGLNLAAPALLFLALYISTYRLKFTWRTYWLRHFYLKKDIGVTVVTASLIFLLITNVVFLMDNELTIRRATNQQEGESQWTFGQTLALLLLSLPLRDTAMLELYRRDAGRRALFAAARQHDAIKLDEILVEPEFNVSSMDENGYTALHIVALRDSAGVAQSVRLLLEHGTDVKAAGRDGNTPLHMLPCGTRRRLHNC
jgi:hypothetical protein